MKDISKFDKTNLRKMHQEMLAVMQKHGFGNVELNTAGANFSSTECTFKFKASIKGTKTESQSFLETMSKIDSIDINKKGPKGETLLEYRSRKPKYPYIYELNGSRYKCDTATAKRMFGI